MIIEYSDYKILFIMTESSEVTVNTETAFVERTIAAAAHVLTQHFLVEIQIKPLLLMEYLWLPRGMLYH